MTSVFRRSALLGVALAALLQAPTASAQTSQGLSPAEIDATVSRAMTQFHTPGVAVGVVRTAS